MTTTTTPPDGIPAENAIAAPSETASNGELLRAAPLPPDQHPVAVYLARLAPGSRRTVRGRLDTLAALVGEGLSAETLPWHRLRYQHTQALRAKVADKYAPAMANATLSALRGVLKEAWRLGYLSAEDYQRAVDLGNVRGERLSHGVALEESEVEALFAQCSTRTVKGLRDRAMLALLFGGGLRRSEACSVRVDQYQAQPSRKRLRVVGKGNVEREIPLGRYAAHLDAWLVARGTAPGPILTSVTPECKRLTPDGGAVYEPNRVARNASGGVVPLTTDGLYKILKDLAAGAGLGHVAPHDARRTRITNLLRSGVDLRQAQRFAGHRQLATTGHYDLRGDDELAQAVDRADHRPAGSSTEPPDPGRSTPPEESAPPAPSGAALRTPRKRR